jgi:hypothetical protein
MYLLAIDPHTKKSAVAIFLEKNKLYKVFEVNTDELVKNPRKYIPVTNAYPKNRRKIAVVEGQWIGKNAKTALKLARTAGRIEGALIGIGFETVEAPAWGNGSWITEMLSIRRRTPNREQVAKISIKIAESTYPDWNFNEHDAAAVCMGLWYLKKLEIKRACA